MRKRLYVVAAFLLLAQIAAAQDTTEQQVGAQAAAATAERIATFNTRDAARISALYAPDAILWGAVSKTIRTNSAEILEYFQASSVRRPRLRMELGEYHVRLYGDIAINAGYYASHEPVDGEDVVVPMRFTFTYRRESGRWMIVNHHSSRFSTP